MNHRKTKYRPPQTPDHGGLIPPNELWGQQLSLLPLSEAALPFDERVAMAWGHIKGTRFTSAEHERLREVLVKLLAKEQLTDRPLQEPLK